MKYFEKLFLKKGILLIVFRLFAIEIGFVVKDKLTMKVSES
jgi:hypothetical protein